MYDTARRVALVKQRVREMGRQRRRREVGGLSAVCLLLFAALMQAVGTLIGQGQTAAQGVFGAMLLREDAGGYVLVAVVSFAAAVVITALCFRLRNRENQKKDGTGKPDPQEQEGKANEETNTQYHASMLHGADAAAGSGLCSGDRRDG